MAVIKDFPLPGISILLLVITTLVITLIIIALCKKDHVKAGLWLRSFGFFLEAGSDGHDHKIEAQK